MVGTSEPLTITLSKPFVIRKFQQAELPFPSIEICKELLIAVLKPVTINNRPFGNCLVMIIMDNGPMLMFKNTE
jgi:hypothetical protein